MIEAEDENVPSKKVRAFERIWFIDNGGVVTVTYFPIPRNLNS